MSKILVEVYVPAAGRRSDLFIPYEAKLFEVTELVKAVFSDDPDSSFTPVDDTLLCDRDTGEIFNVNRSAQELGLENGSRVMLV